MCLEECFAAATWQVAPRREFKHLCPRREFKPLCEKRAKCKDLKVQLHQDYRMPSASSSFEYKETLLHCTDEAKNTRETGAGSAFYSSIFTHVCFLVTQLHFKVSEPFSFRSHLQREPLGAWAGPSWRWFPSETQVTHVLKRWLALPHTPADSCREGCATTRTLLVHQRASLGIIIFLPDAFLSRNSKFEVKR